MRYALLWIGSFIICIPAFRYHRDIQALKKEAQETMPGTNTAAKQKIVKELGDLKQREAIDILVDAFIAIDKVIEDLEKKKDAPGGKKEDRRQQPPPRFGPGGPGGPGGPSGPQQTTSGPLAKIRAEEKLKESIIKELSGMTEDDLVKHMVSKVNGSTVPLARLALSSALLKGGTDEGLKAVEERLEKGKEKTASVLLAIAEAAKKSKNSIPLLTVIIKETPWQPKLAAARALRNIDDNAAIPALIEGLDTAEGKVAYDINDYIKEKVKSKAPDADMQRSYPNWKSWWNTNGKDLFPIEEKAARAPEKK